MCAFIGQFVLPKHTHQTSEKICAHQEESSELAHKGCHKDKENSTKIKCCSEKDAPAAEDHCEDDCDCKCCSHLTTSTFLVNLVIPQFKIFGNYLIQNKFPNVNVNLSDFYFRTFHPPKALV